MSEKSARFNIESHSFIDLKRKQAQIALFKEAIKLKISKFTSKHKELMSSLSRSVTYTKPNQDPSQKKKDLLDCLTCKKSERLNFSYKADNKSKTSMESRSPREVVTTIRGSSNWENRMQPTPSLTEVNSEKAYTYLGNGSEIASKVGVKNKLSIKRQSRGKRSQWIILTQKPYSKSVRMLHLQAIPDLKRGFMLQMGILV